MFCSPLQPVDPFEFFTSPPYHGYRRHQAYNDPITTALLDEQARREAAYEREREQRIRRRLAYEEHQRRQQQARARAQAQAEAEREAAIHRARRMAAARHEYERQLRDLFLQGYRPASHMQEEDDEVEDEHDLASPSRAQAEPSQSYIPIKSYEDAEQSEDEVDTDSEAEEDEQTVEEEYVTAAPTSSASHQIQIEHSGRTEPRISYDEAVAIVQKHAQVALTIRRRLQALNKVRASFSSQQSQFQPPRT